MMKMRERAIFLLAVALFLFKVSAKLSVPPYKNMSAANAAFRIEVRNSTTKPPQPCGMFADGAECPTGQCCSVFGWCGTGKDECEPGYCQSQCPDPYPQGRCGWQAGGRECPEGQCCSFSGWCGSTSDYCDVVWCQSQCSGSFPPGRCGWQADGRKCPTGQCCSISGWCGSTPDYCDCEDCQSQCKIPSPEPSPPPPSPPPPPAYPENRCGKQAGGQECPKPGDCCSEWGWCGSTVSYCAPGYCQSQCKSAQTNYGMRGIESVLLNGVV